MNQHPIRTEHLATGRPEDYDETLAALDTEVMRLGALMTHQVEGDPNHTHYQEQITALSRHAIALAKSRPILEAADARLIATTRRRARLIDLDSDTTARLWNWTKLAGTPGVGGLLLCTLWNPTAWLPIISGGLIAAALAFFVHGTRTRAVLADHLAEADAARAAAAERRAVLRNIVAFGDVLTPGDLDGAQAHPSAPADLHGWPMAAAAAP